MAPPNDPVNATLGLEPSEKVFDLSDGKLTVKGVVLLSHVPENVTFSSFCSICEFRDAPSSILQRVIAASHKGGFLGFSHVSPSDRLINSLGSFRGRNFLSIFRFKTWWSTQWVGNSGSDLQIETQRVLIEVPETESYVVIIPIIEKSFSVRASRFGAIAYVHVAEHPYNLMRETYSALRVHLDSFRLLEEKTIELMIVKVREEIDDLFGGKGKESNESGGCCCKEAECGGMKDFTTDLRTEFKGLDDVYVWNALCGGWGGVRPGTTHLDSKIIPCKLSPGLVGTMKDLAVDKIVEGSIGLVHPHQANDLYDSMHSYLAQAGVTGVKIDVIHSLEYVCEEYGGRVEIAKAYYDGLTNSIIKIFNGSAIIASMQQSTISSSLEPNKFPLEELGAHMIHCSYNSLLMGQIIQPDWDMFQSDHECAKFHAGSRAICGGPVYVSDSVGSHDFDLIKKLVFPDDTVPKCIYFPLPTRDCLFRSPLFDQKTVLKIWNFNKYGGVIGAFNCQGAGWDPKGKKFRGFPECYKAISCTVHVTEVEWDQKKEAEHMGKAEEYVVYLNQAEVLHLMTPVSEPLQLTIQPSTFELYNFVPVEKLGSGNIKFAPIGLTNMFNSGGTIQELEYIEKDVKVKVKGGGRFLAYSTQSPKKFQLNGSDAAFQWLPDCKLTLNLAWIKENGGVSDLAIFF
ncbi:Stachyose synthase [Vigna angularis]|uniref:Stachyose synthase n=2 Tax=Phaseolus angularis TaxID=3914 RepID=A0A8T0L6G4_PHAAN|nr:Stachyose synthase [Vigna angularis]